MTCMPCCNMGAVARKITNSTNITSTKGVTLISDWIRRRDLEREAAKAV